MGKSKWVLLPFIVGLPLLAADDKPRYVAVGNLTSADATQAACGDEQTIFAISNTRLVKYDRATGKELGVTSGEAYHLNSGVLHEGKIYCAHSNYPKKPNESDIRVCDPVTMKLTVFHAFKDPPGSLTWALPSSDGWLCCFAHYGDANGKSLLVVFDTDWKERQRWSFPEKLVGDWGKSSLSGAVRDGDNLLATGHDKKLIYRLKLPAKGTEVEWLATYESPFPGQGIARDPKTGGLMGIDRAQKKVIFATFQK